MDPSGAPGHARQDGRCGPEGAGGGGSQEGSGGLMEAQEIFTHLQAKLGEAVYDFTTAGTKDPYFKVKAASWLDVAKVIKDDPSLAFDFCDNITAVDWLKQGRIDVVYHFYSYSKRHVCVVKIELPRDKPEVPSIAMMWRAADWNEREQFDLMG